MDEDLVGAAPEVAILSDALWKRCFAGAAASVGGTITVNGTGYHVIGVMKPGFKGLTNADAWLPFARYASPVVDACARRSRLRRARPNRARRRSPPRRPTWTSGARSG